MCAAFASCEASNARALQTLRDLVDRKDRNHQSLADAGQAPLKRHPAGVDIASTGRYVEKAVDGGSTQRSYQIEFQVQNDTEHVLSLRAQKWWLRDDGGERFPCRALLVWNEEREAWEASDGRVPAGATRVFTAECRVPQRYEIQHVMRATLHWQYKLGPATHLVATGFATR